MSKAPINTKSSSYARDREVFLKELRQFNESKGISNRPPFVNGKEIDLYLFYLLVTQRGGVGKVNQQGGWDTFLRPLRLPNPCVNGSALLRRIYGACLENRAAAAGREGKRRAPPPPPPRRRYERARGPPGRDDDNDTEDDYRRGRGGIVPRYVHTAQAEWTRFSSRVAGPSERLALSLLSPMPNEQDLAVNVCTVLAADSSNRLPLAATPHILDFLLAHAGVYNHPSLRDTIGRSYREARGAAPDEFWCARAGGGGARELADETRFMASAGERADLVVQALAAHNTLSDRLRAPADKTAPPDPADEDMQCVVVGGSGSTVEPSDDWMSEASDEEQLFAPRLSGGARCVYTQRVIQVASIVRSLSFHEESLPLLAKHPTLLRFLLLCANCWVGTLRQTGLDTLGNIAQELIIKEPATCLLSRHVLSTVQAALVSPDRARVLAALELLNKLAQNEANEDVLLRCLEAEVYAGVCALLTLRDIMLLVCTLECVYALTSLGERACERAVRVTGLIHTLVSLLTVEAQSYGPKACILMRVVETVSGPVDAAPAALVPVAPPPPQHAALSAATTTYSQPSTPVKSRQAAPPPAEPEPPRAATAATAAPAATPLPAAPTAPTNNVQALHAQQQQVQENEQFALSWLRAAWEPCAVAAVGAGGGSDAAEMYRQYVACCQKVGRKGLIAPAHFPRLVRSVFGGTVGPNNVTQPSGETQQVYVGVRARNLAARSAAHAAGPASPILKAQLTSSKQEVSGKLLAAASTAAAPSLATNAAQELPPAPPAAPPAPAGASNTTLIKHLLAHKVAQRQNQQRLLGQPPPTIAASAASTAAPAGLVVDPEELIKCSTITSAGVSSTLPASDHIVKATAQLGADDHSAIKQEQAVEIQIDDNSQITMAGQNKMLADLLEKKSNPPVQVVQMGPQLNAPTIQITETGQIVQVKNEGGVKAETLAPAHSHFVQIKNEQGQIIHLKNDQGQIVHLKNDQGQIFQLKNDGQIINQSGQIIHIKNEQGQILHAGHIMPQQGQIVQQGGQMIQQGGQIIQQSGQVIQGGQIIQGQIIQSSGQLVNQGGQLVQQGGQIIQQGGQIIHQGGQIIQQGGQIIHQGGQIIQQGGHIIQQGGQILQQGQMVTSQIMQQGGQLLQHSQVVQHGGQMLQILPVKKDGEVMETIDLDPDSQEPPTKKMKTEGGGSGGVEGVSKTAANLYAALAASALEDDEDLPPNRKHVIVNKAPPPPPPAAPAAPAAPHHHPPPPVQVQQPVLQVQPMTSQPHQHQHQLILQEKPMVSQSGQFVQQPLQLLAAPTSAQGGLSYITQNLPGHMMPQHKTIIIVQGGGGAGGGPITLTVNNPGGLDEATLNSLISQASEAITQQQMMQNAGVIQPTQRVIHGQGAPPPAPAPTAVATAAAVAAKQGASQLVVGGKPGAGGLLTSSAQVLGGQHVLGQGGQLTSSAQVLGGQQHVLGQGGQLTSSAQVLGGQHVLGQGGQLVTVAGAPHLQRVVHSAPTPTPTPTVIQSNTAPPLQKAAPTPGSIRHVIRQPVMVGGTKIGEKEIVIRHPPAPASPAAPSAAIPAAAALSTEPPPLLHKEVPKLTAKVVPSPAAPAALTAASPVPAAAAASGKHDDTPWICHWKGCGKRFESASGVFGHAARAHCPAGERAEAPCLWLDCDRVPRRSFALANHLHDRHCTADALRALFASRRAAAGDGDGGKSVSLGYPPNAALAALNKHAVDFLNPRELMDDNEGPVTKSIRLTAALILRNLVIYSNTGRRQLRIYEHHLSTIALSSVEASRTIAQVLYDMNNI